MQIGVPDFGDLRLRRRSDNHEIIVLVAARLNLIRRTQQIDIDLKMAAQIDAKSHFRTERG